MNGKKAMFSGLLAAALYQEPVPFAPPYLVMPDELQRVYRGAMPARPPTVVEMWLSRLREQRLQERMLEMSGARAR